MPNFDHFWSDAAAPAPNGGELDAIIARWSVMNPPMLVRLPSLLRRLLQQRNGGPPRRRLWLPGDASRALRVHQLYAADALSELPVKRAALAFANGEELATGAEVVLALVDGLVYTYNEATEQIRCLGVSLEDFLSALQYDDARWLLAINEPHDIHELLDVIREATGAIFQQESGEDEGWRARHGNLADTESPSRHARLYIYPNRDDYPEAPRAHWILEAAIRVGDGDRFLTPLRQESRLDFEVLHRPPDALVLLHTDTAKDEEAPLAPPPGSITDSEVDPASLPPLPAPVGVSALAEERFARGLARLTAIHGDHGLGVMKSLEPICPDLARFIIEYPFGDIYTRPGLDPKSRQIATMASLVTLGHASQELKSHIRGSLNIGVTRTEIIELILQMSVYAGFPAAINAMRAAGEVFNQLDAEKRANHSADH